ncbi:MAG: alpha-hydroxy-acid oxidizing protein [Alphaproteobacteria bacterium]|nr:alpha-hydroxy-acid oxidizing protein [Alphaproteobacteria bacterium]
MSGERAPPNGRLAVQPVTLEDYRALARESVPLDIFDYVDGGAGDEVTVRANRRDFDELLLLPLCLRDVSSPALAVTLFGQEMQFPVGYSPTALHQLVHVDGEFATARAAAALRIPMIVSVMSSIPLEEVVTRSDNNTLWLQLYFFKDRELTKHLVRRAEQVGCKAIVISLGCPVPGRRDRNLRNEFRLPQTVSAANFRRTERTDFNSPIHSLEGAELDSSATWQDLLWLCDFTVLPVVVKGLMNPRDVEPTLKCGASAIMVSNHGGRQLDTTASTIRVLPEFSAAIAGRIPLFVDSGFRRGTDVLKAIILGADCVFLGRPVMWALAAAGEQGVSAMTTLLHNELHVAMQLTGCASIAELRAQGQSLLRQSRPSSVHDD